MLARAATALALLLVLAACGGGGTVVATVEGQEITLAQVEALRPDGDGVLDPFFSQDLQNVILDRILTAAVEELGVAVSQEEIDAGVAEFVGLVTSQTDPSTGLPVRYEDFLAAQATTEAIVELTVAQQLRSEQAVAWFGAQETVTEADIDAALEEGLLAEQAARTEACVSHILLETEEAAGVVLEIVNSDGSDFASTASRYSIGPTGPVGGDLGCAPTSDYVDPFALAIVQAEVGVPYGPVETEFGWHVLLVSERTGPTLDEIRSELVDDIRGIVEDDLRAELGRAAFEEWAGSLPAQADVDLDPEFGQWVPTQSGGRMVIPPNS